MIDAGGTLIEVLHLRSDRDVARARVAVTKALRGAGMRPVGVTRFVTAVSEIARNAVVHGGGGELRLMRRSGPERIVVLCADRGPGIADLDRALEDGFTTGKGLGRGLGGARRLAETFAVDANEGGGTRVRLETRV